MAANGYITSNVAGMELKNDMNQAIFTAATYNSH